MGTTTCESRDTIRLWYYCTCDRIPRGGSRNSLREGFWARILRRGGGVRVQVRGNFHILTSQKKKKTSEGGV